MIALPRWIPSLIVLAAGFAAASSGDPQTKTEHPWYPGELSCSTFERLFKTEAALYTRVTGRKTDNDEDKALAAWYWRNLNYHHADDAQMDYWGKGFKQADYNRDYWTGLFGFGFGLCYTTHAQFCGEMEYLLGHSKARASGVPGHTSFEVFLTGGAYGDGLWALLDHDVSTVIFKEDGSRLLSIKEISAELAKYRNPQFKPERQRGWLVGGLHPSDPGAYQQHKTAMYYYGYAGIPPLVHLRSGESLRRYIQPGLDDGKTYVFWGQTYKNIDNVIGPERNRTWVNQPEKMYKATRDTGQKNGQGRFGNAVYTYKPDFKGKYKEGVIDESDKHVTFEFYSPYVIAAMPPDVDAPKPDNWDVYLPGGKKGLVLKGTMTCPVKVSIDQGKTWQEPGNATDGMDLTDIVKGCKQYWIRFEAAPAALADTGLTMITTCQCNQCIVPRLTDGKNPITFQASGLAMISAGPNMAQAEAHVVDGKIGTPTVTLELATPHKEKAVQVYVNAHVASGSPPRDCTYQTDYSSDGGKTWKPVVKDWKIIRRPVEPDDFWSQSMYFGNAALEDVTEPIRIRWKNDGGRTNMRVEAHLAYKVAEPGAVDVTYAWKEGGGEIKKASHTYAGAAGEEDKSWTIDCGKAVETVWVEYAVK